MIERVFGQSNCQCGDRSTSNGKKAMVVFENAAPPFSEVDIRRVEHRFGVSSPQDLKEHYPPTVDNRALDFS